MPSKTLCNFSKNKSSVSGFKSCGRGLRGLITVYKNSRQNFMQFSKIQGSVLGFESCSRGLRDMSSTLLDNWTRIRQVHQFRCAKAWATAAGCAMTPDLPGRARIPPASAGLPPAWRWQSEWQWYSRPATASHNGGGSVRTAVGVKLPWGGAAHRRLTTSLCGPGCRGQMGLQIHSVKEGCNKLFCVVRVNLLPHMPCSAL